MGTSLSEQLKRLALPQTTLLQRDKKRASLLFDPKEAAGLKRETVYQIGLDGLEELISKDQSFEQFKNNLFHITSKKFERAMETTESNKKLDKVIRKFLLHLTPFFLLNCSHKPLEWLINRFCIHEYNREDLLMAIMPYHESNMFVRVVQLMKFKDQNDSWFFLKSFQKSGVHLTKQSLLTHAASDVYFLKFVGKFITLLIKQFEKPSLLTVAFNFYCAVYAGAIEYSTELNEAQITQMLPALIKGLNSDIPDYCAASYIILGRLVLKIPLTDVILSKFVEKVAEAKVETLKTESVLVLLVLYQSQPHYGVVPDEACNSLVGKEWLAKVLQELSNGNYHVAPFLKALVKACVNGAVKMDQEGHREFVKKLLAVVKFDTEFVEIFLSLLLDNTKSKKQHSDHIKQWLTEIITTIERQYPDQFDSQVYKILSTTRQGKFIKRRKSLQKILKETMTVRCKFDVLDKLYHPNPTFRREAIRYLTNNYDSLRDREKEMIKSSFVDRLNDDDVNVVAETLTLIKNISVLKADDLKEVLTKLTYKCQHDLKTWGAVSTDVVLMLCANSDPNDWETFVAVFPYLLPQTEEQLEAARGITQVSFIKKNPLLRKINGKLEQCEKFCNNVFDSLRNESNDLVESFIQSLKQTPLEERSALNKYLVTLILSCLLPNNSSIETNVEIVTIFVKCLDRCEIRYEKGNALFHKHISAARAGRFHIEGFLLCLKNVIVKTTKPEVNLGRLDFHDDSSFNRYFISLAGALFKSSPNHKKYCLFFVNYFCKSLRSKLEFILNLASCGKCIDVASECVDLVVRLLEPSAKENKRSLLNDGEVLLPFVLAMLVHKSDTIKTKMFKVVELLALMEGDVYQHLFRELLDQREEIIADNDQMPLILFNYLSPSAIKDKKIVANAETLKTLLVKASSKENYPVYLKAKMLELLSHINTIDISQDVVEDCLNLFETEASRLDDVKSTIVLRTIMRYQANMAPEIELDSGIWRFVETCLKKDNLTLTIDGKDKFAAILLLEQITKDFFASLTKKVQLKLLDLVVEVAAVTKNPEVLPSVRHIIKIIDLDSKLILPHFIALRDVQSPKLDPNKMKRRIYVVPTVDILDTLDWRKGLTALEFIQDKKKIRNIELLVPVLFEVLKKCLDFDEQPAMEYPKQLILSSILDLGNRMDREKLQETVFNMELIVQCIRASQNPQTHYCALLVLAFSAELFPTQVLLNMMAIFTFMGSSLLRHEDAYSFQIISKIIDTIIPILVKGGDAETIAKVLRVFVDVLLDVPEHRRLPIYEQLLAKIGASEHLYVFLLLIFESHVNHSGHTRHKNKDDDMKRLKIAASICREFSPRIVIENCIHLMKYLKELPDEVETDNTTSGFNILYKTPKQFRHFKYTLIVFTSKLLASREFVLQVAALTNEELLELELLYKDTIINVLTYIHRVSKIADKSATTPHSKYWKVILHLSYDILDSVNAILTPQMFVLVIKGLMVHNFATVRRRSMELLNSKLQNTPTFFTECSSEQIYVLVPPLLTIIKNVEEVNTESEEELIVQTALLSLKLLVKVLVAEHTEKLTEILDYLTDLTKTGKIQNNVLASVLLCIAELCANLRAHAIPSLPNFMPALLKILKQQKNQESSLLLLSCITAVQKVLDTLPLFLSPYLEKLLYELALLTSRWGDTNEEKWQPVVNKLSTVRQQIGTSIPSRVLIPALGQSYNQLITKNAFSAITFLMEVLGENLNHLSGSEINANLPELTNFFLNALQFRTDQQTSFQQANEVEAQIVKALTKLVLKLSESTFKPLYYKLFDWAARHDQKTERLITFYALSSSIAESLKSLFVLFAGHFLNNAAQILDACNVIKNETLYFGEENKDVLLLENVLKTLHAVFLYDNHKFVNKDRFQVLMQPLVDQLENTLSGVKSLEERSAQIVTPAIVQFAVATADDSLWKQLNYQILLKMKHNSPNIRLISLHCLKEMVQKLGVDYLPLLPETIPVLAELLEDEEESVEKACRKAVQEMEKILGEPIEKYFKM